MKVFVLFLALAMSAACTHQARIYDVAGGPPLTAKFTARGTGHGRIEMQLPSGERCTGEYATSSAGLGAYGGSAVILGDAGTSLHCDFVLLGGGNSGHGQCQDNHGRQYTLIF